MMRYLSFASGSSGNCALLRGGGVDILIDVGISTRRIRTSLREWGLEAADVTAILVTHEHRDHIGGLQVWTKQFDTPVYASRGTAEALLRDGLCAEKNLRILPESGRLDLGELCIRPIPLSHDASEPVGYRVEGETGALCVLTDLGVVTDTVLNAARGCDFAVVETNHDVELLRCGPYPQALQRRILGEKGHLSNEAGAELAYELMTSGAKEVLLGHLSAENNREELALRAVEARCGRELRVSAAPRSTYSREIQIG